MSDSLQKKILCALALGVLLVQAAKASAYAICSGKGVVAYIGDDHKIYPPGTTSPTPSGIASCDSGELVIDAVPSFNIGQSPFCSTPQGDCS
ncbi:hypothetical protein DFH28DRAFT_424268 [Melampsora americana]|nr:hypothetical protein DFH28DRAFT_424268 [Melampsora americana]